VIGHLLGRLASFQRSIARVDKCRVAAHEALGILRGAHRPEETIMALTSLPNFPSIDVAQNADVEKAAEEAFRIAQELDNAWAMFQQEVWSGIRVADMKWGGRFWQAKNKDFAGGQTQVSVIDSLAKLSQIAVEGTVIEGP